MQAIEDVIKRVVLLVMWLCVGAHLWLHVWRPEVTTSDVIFCKPSALFFETRVFPGQEITKKGRLLGAQGFHCPSQRWDSKQASPCLAFLDKGSRDQTQCHTCMARYLLSYDPSPKQYCFVFFCFFLCFKTNTGTIGKDGRNIQACNWRV